jgi:hypothetical protein
MASTAELTATFEQIAGHALAPGRYSPRKDGSLREIREDGHVVHAADSELAKAAQALWAAKVAEWRAPRPATRADANMNEEIALIAECNAHAARQRGDLDDAERQATQARRRKRRAWMIRRHLNWAEHAPHSPPLDTPRPIALASPRERRERRSSSPSRAGPDDGEPSEPPPAGRRCACGEHDISHKRAGALYFDEACRKRVERAAAKHRSRQPNASRWARSLAYAAITEQLADAAADGRIAPERTERLIRVLERERLELLGTKVCGRQYSKNGRTAWYRCGGALVADADGDPVCMRCGRPCSKITTRLNGYDETAALMRELPKDNSLPAHKAPREWRTRPSRKLSAKLRGTRGRWDKHASGEERLA